MPIDLWAYEVFKVEKLTGLNGFQYSSIAWNEFPAKISNGGIARGYTKMK